MFQSLPGLGSYVMFCKLLSIIIQTKPDTDSITGFTVFFYVIAL